MERRWWQHYLRNKSPQVYLADKKAYWQRVMNQLEQPLHSGAKALDAGCGPAGIFLFLHNQQQLTALDPLLDQYEADLPIFSKSHYPGVIFRAEPIETSNLTETFDIIYCFNAINHVADWSLALDRLTDWSRPGTRLILSSDVHRHQWLLPIFRVLPGDMLHPQQHAVAAYREALETRGWIIEKEVVLRQEAIFDYTAWCCLKA